MWNNANNHAISRPGFSDDLLARMRELKRQFADTPTSYVMTTATLERVRNKVPERMPSGIEHKAVLPSAFMGMPIEDYATMKECMDRMMQASEMDRPQLVTSGDEVTPELMSHPFMKREAASLAMKYGVS